MKPKTHAPTPTDPQTRVLERATAEGWTVRETAFFGSSLYVRAERGEASYWATERLTGTVGPRGAIKLNHRYLCSRRPPTKIRTTIHLRVVLRRYATRVAGVGE